MATGTIMIIIANRRRVHPTAETDALIICDNKKNRFSRRKITGGKSGFYVGFKGKGSRVL